MERIRRDTRGHGHHRSLYRISCEACWAVGPGETSSDDDDDDDNQEEGYDFCCNEEGESSSAEPGVEPCYSAAGGPGRQGRGGAKAGAVEYQNHESTVGGEDESTGDANANARTDRHILSQGRETHSLTGSSGTQTRDLEIDAGHSGYKGREGCGYKSRY